MHWTRRRFGRASLGGGSTTLLASSLDGSDGDPDGTDPATSSAAPSFDSWVPLPEETNGSSRYASFDVVFRNVEAMAGWSADVDAAFASRELIIRDPVRFDVEPDSFAARIDTSKLD